MTDKPSRTINVDVVLAVGVAAAMLGIVQFLIITTLAMRNYRGGSRLDTELPAAMRAATETDYGWSRNFLSDLGLQKAWSGKDNRDISRYFNGSIIILGLTLVAFFALSVRASEQGDLVAIAIAAAGALSSLGLVGLGMTPYDVLFFDHHLMLAVWILPLPVIAVAFALQCFRSGNRIGYASGSVAGLAAIALILAILAYAVAPSFRDRVIMQKVFVGISIVWFSIVVCRVALASIIVISPRNPLRERLAEKYLRKISKKHLRPHRPDD